MAHVIVIGAGLGGIPAAFDLRKHLGKNHRVTLIGARPYFEFTPSNPWIAVGWRTSKETQVQMQTPLDKKGVEWHVNTVTQIDAENSKLTLDDGKELAYDYLVIATGPRLAFEEVPGLGPEGFTQSVCSQDHSEQAWTKLPGLLEKSGPIIIGAAPGASCFGPAYETAMVIDADLRKRKLRDRVPMTYVTSEPYIGHMGLGGVGDSKGLMESELRERHIKWITNAKMTSVTANEMTVQELTEDGALKKEHKLPFVYGAVIPGLQGRRCGCRRTGTVQSARLRLDRQTSTQPEVQEHLLRRCLRGDPSCRSHPGTHGRAEDRLHDRIHGLRNGLQYRSGNRRATRRSRSDLECDLSRGFR